MIALSEDIEQLARLLAKTSGETPAEIIRQALQDRARAPDEVIGYDECGVPR
jgi:hypothetical protein